MQVPFAQIRPFPPHCVLSVQGVHVPALQTCPPAQSVLTVHIGVTPAQLPLMHESPPLHWADAVHGTQAPAVQTWLLGQELFEAQEAGGGALHDPLTQL